MLFFIRPKYLIRVKTTLMEMIPSHVQCVASARIAFGIVLQGGLG